MPFKRVSTVQSMTLKSPFSDIIFVEYILSVMLLGNYIASSWFA